jgi:hypothetical protein
MIIFIILLLLALIAYGYYSGKVMNRPILSHGHRRYVAPPFSPSEFYNEVKRQVQAKQIGNVTIDTVNFSEGGLMSANREYLRIRYKEYFFYVCAAPFGTGYFVSWWLGDIGDPIRDLLVNIPLIGKAFNKKPKTFFEHDTSLMFKETINDCVNDAIENLTNAKGVRGLPDSNWHEYNKMFS